MEVESRKTETEEQLVTAVIATPAIVKTNSGDLDLAGNLNLRRNSIFVGIFFWGGGGLRREGEEDEAKLPGSSDFYRADKYGGPR